MTLGAVDAALDRTGSPLRRCTPDPERFLRETWGVRAAIHRGADARGFADLLTLDDVDRLLSTSLRTPAFRLVCAGDQIPESAYTRSGRTGSKPVSGMADPARIFELFDDGATIVLQGLHRYHEPVTRFCRDLELELGHPCQVNAYITPPGAQGLALHSDPHDVLVLQAFGRKQWQVHPAPGEEPREPLAGELGPGDCIYMPEGTPHAATTQETLSGHLTIGVHVGSWREVLTDVWTTVGGDSSLDDRVPAGWTRDPAAFAEELSARLRGVAAAVGHVDTDDVATARLERFLSTRASIVRGSLSDRQELDGLHDDTVLERREGTVCRLIPRPDRLVALLGDRRLEMPPWVEPAMRRVATASTVRVGELGDELGDRQSGSVLARRLVREGLLSIRRER